MPPPCLLSPPLPVIVDASVVLPALLVVSVPVPSAITPPAPDSAPTVCLLPLRLKVPPLTVNALPATSDAPRPSCRVPAFTVVPPL
jgi:hypothetical protein